MERQRKMLNQTKNETQEMEKITINLPKNIIEYYRVIAHFQETTETNLIEEDLIEKLEADLEGRSGPDWKKMFNL